MILSAIRKILSRPHRQSGNILIYILGAIFLLGLLIIIVRGSSTPGGGINEETLVLKVAEVQQYGAELENAVSFILQKGISEEDIRFAHPDADPAYGVITDNPERQVFSKLGGGATYRAPPTNIQDVVTSWNFNGSSSVRSVGNDGAPEIVAWLPYVTKEFCFAINEAVGVQNNGDDPPRDNNSINITRHYDGRFDIAIASVNSSAFATKLQGCMEGDVLPPRDTYHYYRVLLAR